MVSKLTCIVIDDEPLAREGIENFVQQVPLLVLKGSYSKPILAIEKIKAEKIDLIFLDIQMPGMNGLELLQTLAEPPLTIISTAFSEYAIKAYDLNVLDYLVKPVSFVRFLKAVNKARDFYDQKNRYDPVAAVPEKNFFFIKCDKTLEKIFFHDLIFVQALQNYVILQTLEKRYVSYLTIKSVEAHLPSGKFLRVSKSVIVAVEKINHIRSNEIVMGENIFIIGRRHKDEVMKRVNQYLVKRS